MGKMLSCGIVGQPLEAEKVMSENPDIIIKWPSSSKIENCGYESDDPSDFQALRESIMNRPELSRVSAVENECTYIIYASLTAGLVQPVGVAYYAKWFHPELFEDLDPQGIHQEFLTEYQGLDYDLDEHGVFVYPDAE
ncbi:MAG: hypothetical protein U9N48_06510 [Euryarchaeota archaeon]|nr:hypothetical protein [Euryarchaeota archaeon]